MRECYRSQPGYSSSGCDHYGVHFCNCLKQPTRTTYRWLLPDAARPGMLLREGTDVPVPAPVWTVTPATATALAVVVAPVVVPPSPTPRYGDARLIGAQIAAANIPVPSITVTRAGTGSGSVGGDGAAKGINCGGSCAVATPNAVGTLTAKPDSKSAFGGRGGACAGQTGRTCSLTIGTPLAASATFNLLPIGGGRGGGTSGGGGGTTTGNVTLTVSLGNPGLVTGNGINCGTQCSTSVAAGTVITLTASPLPGLAFTGWSGACSGQAGNVCTLTMTKSLSTKAGFSK